MSYETPEKKQPGAFRRVLFGIGRFITWLRVVLANLLFLGLLVLLLFTVSPQPTVPLPEDFALRLRPSGVLVDEHTYIAPLQMMLGGTNIEQSETLVRDLVQAIDHASEDERVTGLVLELDDLMGGGISKLAEVGAALDRFKESGKPIYAVSSNYNQDQYYLASYADEIYLHDMGMVLLTGYESYRHYYKEALDKLAVNVHVFRAGQYKDFIEPFTRNSMSEASQEHVSDWLNQLWGSYTTRVEEQRGLPAGSLTQQIDTMDERLQAHQGNAAELALDSNWVDQIMNHRGFDEVLLEQFGSSPYGDGYRGVLYSDYLADVEARSAESPDKIGLIVASGSIMEGQQPNGNIGSETFIQQIQQVRENPEIKALVVRIDSGGGSAFASEVIRTELESLRADGVPVLVSMGSVAASGGYWMAMGADQVWATPTTLTGSIGVFGAFPTFEDSLEKLGINTDGLGTTELSGSNRIDLPLSPEAQNLIQQSVDNIYGRFIGLVAASRGMEPEQVQNLAQGRVWSGSSALELGLVDQLGYLQDVVDEAAKQAELFHYEVQVVEPPPNPLVAFIEQLQGGQAANLWSAQGEQPVARLARQLNPLLEPLKALEPMKNREGIYARCVECVAP